MPRLFSSFMRASVLGLAAMSTMVCLPEDAEASKFISSYNMPDLSWKTIKTEHFQVHYPVSRRSKEKGNAHYIDGEWAARKMAQVAEEMWEPMCKEFDYPLDETIHIVLLEQADRLEGFTIPAWDWVEISANPGAYFYRMRGRMEWMSDVLVHEFAHVVSLKRNSALAEGTGGILIGGLFSDGINDQISGGEIVIGDTDPFWWTEGGAEYWSDQTGYNWWTPSRDMNLRTTVLEDRLLTFDEWSTRIQSFDWGDGERGYQQGYSIALYLRQRFGEKTFNEFANQSDVRWRARWETVVEEVTGVTAEQLYLDWKAFLEKYYTAVYDDVIAQGEVEGRELETKRHKFEFTNPVERDAFFTADTKEGEKKKAKTKDAYEREKERSGTWELYPKYSDDGKWFAQHNRGSIQIHSANESLYPGATGDAGAAPTSGREQQEMSQMRVTLPSEFMHGYDFVPGQDKVVLTVSEATMDRLNKRKMVPHIETNGYDWKNLAVYDLIPETSERKHLGEKESFETLWPKQSKLKAKLSNRWRGKMTIIPNTERGTDPSVSPDGTRIVFHEYRDGTLNLATINLDGSDKQYLTDFNDGTWLQGADWSPDGTKIVFSIFRNYRQDMYVINADGTGLTAINQDEWEDQDAFWAADGNIYFSSEPTGIFNIFRYNPDTGSIHQLTNVIGGAQSPSITPTGDLMYTQFTAHGWKNFILDQDEFLEKEATDLFTLEFDEETMKQDLAHREDLSKFESMTSSYKPMKSIMAPTAVPMFRFENDSQTDWGMSAGVQLFAQDFVEYHSMFTQFLLGESPFGMIQYQYHGWHPDLTIFAYHTEVKSRFGFLVDDDDDLGTTDDQGVYEVKQNQAVDVVLGRMDYVVNPTTDWFLFARGLQYSFRSGASLQFDPFIRNFTFGTGIQFHNRPTAYARSAANPRGYRIVEGTLSHGYSDLVYAPQKGRETDDGEILDKYQYNQIDVRWTEHVPLNVFKFQRTQRHTLQLDFQGGFIDRNVHTFDEYRAGGRHPYFFGPGAVQPNTQFAGYPGASLLGETLLMGSFAYRFPIVTDIDKRLGGMLFLKDIFFQVGGSAGNLWSYRPPEEEDVGSYYYDDQGERVAYDPSSIRREIPFVDKAYKNGNYLLTDVTAEVRLSSVFLGRPWNSFFRVAYGFQEVGGIFDVDGDSINDATDTGFGNALSSETEKPGPRFYFGLGTGW